jgi:uncharacterized membrane protein YhaH (DUF805 family)
MEYILNTYRNNYINFNGRVRRREFWAYILFFVITVIILTIIDLMIGIFYMEIGLGILSGLFIIFSILPTLSIATRRLHDINKSGWWQLLGIIPIIGAFILFIFYAIDSFPGQNNFGYNPK